jgi:hypothetical protein
MATLIGETIGKIVQILGFDGTDYRPFKVDSNGQLLVGNMVTLPSLTAKRRHYIKSVLYESRNGSANSGNITLNFTAVPAGYYAVYFSVACYLSAGSAGYIQMHVMCDGVNYPMSNQNTAAVPRTNELPRELILDEGSNIRVIATGVGSGTGFYCFAGCYYIPKS